MKSLKYALLIGIGFACTIPKVFAIDLTDQDIAALASVEKKSQSR